MEKPKIPETFHLNLSRNRFDECISEWCQHLSKHSHHVNQFHQPKLKHLQKSTLSECYLSRERLHADVFIQLANYFKKHRNKTTQIHQHVGAAAPTLPQEVSKNHIEMI